MHFGPILARAEGNKMQVPNESYTPKLILCLSSHENVSLIPSSLSIDTVKFSLRVCVNLLKTKSYGGFG